jgi:hypothetical protein
LKEIARTYNITVRDSSAEQDLRNSIFEQGGDDPEDLLFRIRHEMTRQSMEDALAALGYEDMLGAKYPELTQLLDEVIQEYLIARLPPVPQKAGPSTTTSRAGPSTTTSRAGPSTTTSRAGPSQPVRYPSPPLPSETARPNERALRVQVDRDTNEDKIRSLMGKKGRLVDWFLLHKHRQKTAFADVRMYFLSMSLQIATYLITDD